MYEVIDIGLMTTKDRWEVLKSGKRIFKGTFRETVRYCISDLGFNVLDFEKSISALIYNSHDTLVFDDKGRLDHSYRKSDSKK